MKKLLLALLIMGMWALPTSAQVGLFVRPNSSSLSSPVTGQTWLFNSSNYTVSTWNGSSFQLTSFPKSNFVASGAPTTSNDSTQGYSLGSEWYYGSGPTFYICVDPTASAAVWLQVNSSTSIPLSYLQAGGASSGQSLIYNGSHWAAGSPYVALDHFLQSGALNGQVPVWNGANWVASALPGAGGPVALSQLLQDSATNGQVLTWNSTDGAWEPANGGGSLPAATNQGQFIISNSTFGYPFNVVRTLYMEDLPVGDTPTVVPDVNAGTGATANFIGTPQDMYGQIAVTIGTGAGASGNIVDVTMGDASITPGVVIVVPADQPTAVAMAAGFIYASGIGFAPGGWGIGGMPSSLTPAATYTFSYLLYPASNNTGP